MFSDMHDHCCCCDDKYWPWVEPREISKEERAQLDKAYEVLRVGARDAMDRIILDAFKDLPEALKS